MNPSPPKLLLRFFRWFCHPELHRYIEGDLLELYEERVKEKGRRAANLRFALNVLLLFRPSIIRPFPRIKSLDYYAMYQVRFSLLSALRQAKRHPLRTSVQLLGLLISFSCALLIGFHLVFHFSFDQHVSNADRIYRVAVDRNYLNGEKQSNATSSFPLANALAQDLSSVEEATQLISSQFMQEQAMVSVNSTRYYEEKILYAEANFPSFFELNLLQTSAPLSGYSVYLSERVALKYFGKDDPLGQLMLLGDTLAVKVQGVFQDQPATSHLQLPLLLSMDVFDAVAGSNARSIWGWDLAYTYIRLTPTSDPAQTAFRFDALFAKYNSNFSEKRGYVYTAELQPLTDIHLYSQRIWELEPGENPANLYLLAGACLLLLIISTVNFVNLLAAQVYRQTKVIGMKKVMGATPLSLYIHFVVEIGAQLLLVLMLSGVTVHLLLPSLSSLTNITSQTYLDAAAGTVLIGAIITTMVFLLITSNHLYLLIRPIKPRVLLNRNAANAYRLGIFSKGLLLIQFALALLLTLGATTLYKQRQLLQSQSLGFAQDHTLIFSLDEVEKPHLDALKNALANQANVKSVTATSSYPGGRSERMRMRQQGQPDYLPVNLLYVDYDFLETLTIPLVAGRNFDQQYATDSTVRFIVNRTAVEAFKIDMEEGAQLAWPTIYGTYRGDVIGVMEDFHFASLTQAIEPMVLVTFPRFNYVLVKINPQQVATTIAHIEDVFQTVMPEQTFNYRWLDQSLADQYQKEAKLDTLIGLFTILSIFIALIGLIALADILIESRVKEVGIRKVLGASAGQIILLINRQFIRLLLLSMVVAIPAALFLTNRWLEQYVYRVPVDVGMTVTICLVSLLLILGTVSLKSLKAALANPVDSLKNE